MSATFDGKRHFALLMEGVAADCLNGRDELTRLWGAFFLEFTNVARAIGYSESDGGMEYPIREMIRSRDALRSRFCEIESYIEPYARVAEEAVREAIEAKVRGVSPRGGPS
jgi:hypothetical protein